MNNNTNPQKNTNETNDTSIRFRRTCDNKSFDKSPETKEVTPTIENQNESVADRRSFLKNLIGATTVAALLNKTAVAETDQQPARVTTEQEQQIEQFGDLTSKLLNGETKTERAAALQKIAVMLFNSDEVLKFSLPVGLYIYARTNQMPYKEAKDFIAAFIKDFEQQLS